MIHAPYDSPMLTRPRIARGLAALAAISLLALGACDSDDGMGPTVDPPPTEELTETVRDLRAIGVGAGTVFVEWAPPDTLEAYLYELSVQQGENTRQLATHHSSTEYLIEDLEPGGIYDIQVRASIRSKTGTTPVLIYGPWQTYTVAAVDVAGPEPATQIGPGGSLREGHLKLELSYSLRDRYTGLPISEVHLRFSRTPVLSEWAWHGATDAKVEFLDADQNAHDLEYHDLSSLGSTYIGVRGVDAAGNLSELRSFGPVSIAAGPAYVLPAEHQPSAAAEPWLILPPAQSGSVSYCETSPVVVEDRAISRYMSPSCDGLVPQTVDMLSMLSDPGNRNCASWLGNGRMYLAAFVTRSIEIRSVDPSDWSVELAPPVQISRHKDGVSIGFVEYGPVDDKSICLAVTDSEHLQLWSVSGHLVLERDLTAESDDERPLKHWTVVERGDGVELFATSWSGHKVHLYQLGDALVRTSTYEFGGARLVPGLGARPFVSRSSETVWVLARLYGGSDPDNQVSGIIALWKHQGGDPRFSVTPLPTSDWYAPVICTRSFRGLYYISRPGSELMVVGGKG